MKFATVRQLKNKTSEMLRAAANGNEVLITSHGRPVALLHGIRQEDLEDYVLSHHRGIRHSIEQAHRQYRKRGGVRLEEFCQRLKLKRKKRGGKLRR